MQQFYKSARYSTGAMVIDERINNGGQIDYGDNPQHVDGGFLSVQSFGMWDIAGNRTVGGYCVDPDYDIDDNLVEHVKGNYEQLEKAIRVINEELQNNPVKKLQKPPYPDKSK